jgi:hypothetical protein
MRSIRASVAACVATLVLAVRAESQVVVSPSAADRSTARAQFEQGVAAARDGHWHEASESFSRSYALVPEPLVLLNLAAAQAEDGSLVAAAETYRTFLAAPLAGEAAQMRAAAQDGLQRVEARVAHVVISIDAPNGADAVTIDGVALPRAALGIDRPLDPGAHTIVWTRAPHRETRRIDLADAAHERVRFVAPADERVRLADVERRPHGSVFGSPWFWVGAGVVVAAGVATGVCAAAGCFRSPEPTGTAGFGTWP